MKRHEVRRQGIGVRLDADQLAALDRAAELLARRRGEDVTRSDVIREAVDYYVQHKGWTGK